MEDIQLYPSSQCPGYQGVYFKSWVGESSGTPPNGGGESLARIFADVRRRSRLLPQRLRQERLHGGHPSPHRR
jgi:hypothetical protein